MHKSCNTSAWTIPQSLTFFPSMRRDRTRISAPRRGHDITHYVKQRNLPIMIPPGKLDGRLRTFHTAKLNTIRSTLRDTALSTIDKGRNILMKTHHYKTRTSVRTDARTQASWIDDSINCTTTGIGQHRARVWSKLDVSFCCPMICQSLLPLYNLMIDTAGVIILFYHHY